MKRKKYRTTIVFTLQDKIGALYDALLPFKKNKINLTRIISRPHPKKEWQYIFFIEIDGKKDDPRVKKTIKELQHQAVTVNLYGSYPLIEIL